MIRLHDKWVWDFWFAQDESDIHIFYLQAPRAIGDESLRHWNVSIGHAVSQDLVHWEILPDALIPSSEYGAWDNYTTWTGSIVKHAGTWFMFYTGTSRQENGKIQRIGLATSNDLIHWERFLPGALIEPDPQWYETFDLDLWHEQTWRDPWVFESEGKFHAFITARCNTEEKFGRGVIGYAVSSDLVTWEVRSPMTNPGDFAYMEVPQLTEINGLWYLFFSVTNNMYSKARHARPEIKQHTGTHYLVAHHPLGPFNYLTNDFLVGDEMGSLYAGKVIRSPFGEWSFLAFEHYSLGRMFIGKITDPFPMRVQENGQLFIPHRLA